MAKNRFLAEVNFNFGQRNIANHHIYLLWVAYWLLSSKSVWLMISRLVFIWFGWSGHYFFFYWYNIEIFFLNISVYSQTAVKGNSKRGSGAYSEPGQTSKTEFFCENELKTVNNFRKQFMSYVEWVDTTILLLEKVF